MIGEKFVIQHASLADRWATQFGWTGRVDGAIQFDTIDGAEKWNTINFSGMHKVTKAPPLDEEGMVHRQATTEYNPYG
jgi:hypothetical protein